MVDGIITMNALSSLPELTTMIGDAPWVQCAEYADTGSISCVGINDVEALRGRCPDWPIAAPPHRAH
ncbi:ribose operon repressor [Klebsiella pneumoniae]|uniref:Ribose operon repressor n=1 Tax=Klebsiella pneumoniae TaxID=573 RepID=A0A377TMK6_KLEPN|nr:ribose operon repressor [Klebsiella pneumoniae]